MALRFVWDARKATANERKHGVGFLEATTVFDDPLSVTISDPDHSLDEQRCLILGVSSHDGCSSSPIPSVVSRSVSSARDA